MKINDDDDVDDNDNDVDDDDYYYYNRGTPASRTIEVQKGCSRFCIL
jgi:hypothetical protein